MDFVPVSKSAIAETFDQFWGGVEFKSDVDYLERMDRWNIQGIHWFIRFVVLENFGLVKAKIPEKFQANKNRWVPYFENEVQNPQDE